jgi:hypothetical protein
MPGRIYQRVGLTMSIIIKHSSHAVEEASSRGNRGNWWSVVYTEGNGSRTSEIFALSPDQARMIAGLLFPEVRAVEPQTGSHPWD